MGSYKPCRFACSVCKESPGRDYKSCVCSFVIRVRGLGSDQGPGNRVGSLRGPATTDIKDAYLRGRFDLDALRGPATKNALQILSRESPSDRLSNRRRATSFGSSLASAGTSLRLWSRSTSTPAISSSTKTRRRSPARSRLSLPVTTSPPTARCAARGPADLSQEKWRTRHDSNVRPAE